MQLRKQFGLLFDALQERLQLRRLALSCPGNLGFDALQASMKRLEERSRFSGCGQKRMTR